MSIQSPGSDTDPPFHTQRITLGLPTPSLTEAFAKRAPKIYNIDKDGQEIGNSSALDLSGSSDKLESPAFHTAAHCPRNGLR